MNHERIAYMSFLLRLWLEDGGEYEGSEPFAGEWRASLEDPHTRSMQVFASLGALFDFLRRETSARAPGEGSERQQAAGSENPSTHTLGG